MPSIDLNLFNKSPVQWKNVSFNSYANFNGVQLGASSDGVHQMCCGNLDVATTITSTFSLVKTDFGIKNPKRIRYVYVGFRSAKDLILSLVVDGKASRSYKLKANSDEQQRTRITIDRDLDQKGRYWQFTITNVAGADFSIDYIGVLPVILSEGFK